jgi:hypothetical protein
MVHLLGAMGKGEFVYTGKLERGFSDEDKRRMLGAAPPTNQKKCRLRRPLWASVRTGSDPAAFAGAFRT